MRILFLTRSFNSLTQRLYVALTERGHSVSIEYDIADSVAEEAVEAFAPDLIVAPFLKRALPESIWRNHVCLIVHPGIVGDRGPSALDWAIMNGERDWGVTVLQAIAEMDAGPVWASATFPMRAAPKSSLYRNEVTDAAEQAVLLAVERFATRTFRPVPLTQAHARGQARPLMTQEERRIDWDCDTVEVILRKIRAADGAPGVQDNLFGVPCYLYDAHAERLSEPAAPGTIVARRDGASPACSRRRRCLDRPCEARGCRARVQAAGRARLPRRSPCAGHIAGAARGAFRWHRLPRNPL